MARVPFACPTFVSPTANPVGPETWRSIPVCTYPRRLLSLPTPWRRSASSRPLRRREGRLAAAMSVHRARLDVLERSIPRPSPARCAPGCPGGGGAAGARTPRMERARPYPHPRQGQLHAALPHASNGQRACAPALRRRDTLRPRDSPELGCLNVYRLAQAVLVRRRRRPGLRRLADELDAWASPTRRFPAARW